MKEGQPKDDKKHILREAFFDLYGVPMSWAISAAGMDNPLGEQWRKRLKHFQEVLTQGSQSEGPKNQSSSDNTQGGE